jgi:hypothetical protein
MTLTAGFTRDRRVVGVRFVILVKRGLAARLSCRRRRAHHRACPRSPPCDGLENIVDSRQQGRGSRGSHT